MTQVERVIAAARGELGYTESPAGSNRTKYGEAYGWNGVPWCVIFLWWVFRQAGVPELFGGGTRTASCAALLHWYASRGQTAAVSEVQPGDIVLLNFHGGTEAEHGGIVANARRLPSGAVGIIQTIEGNTSPGLEGSQDNGGCVALKQRFKGQIVEVLRPMYEDKSETDWDGHWAAEHIRRAIDRGLMTGYEDGSWRPDQPVTRAELAAVLHRLEGTKS